MVSSQRDRSSSLLFIILHIAILCFRYMARLVTYEPVFFEYNIKNIYRLFAEKEIWLNVILVENVLRAIRLGCRHWAESIYQRACETLITVLFAWRIYWRADETLITVLFACRKLTSTSAASNFLYVLHRGPDWAGNKPKCSTCSSQSSSHLSCLLVGQDRPPVQIIFTPSECWCN